ncbi:MAG: DEAD/DEAH box helicase, partial [Planctomycetia bacterium]|nr:DEAD/DEAH box helicase [Planctomycetia bacterium]
MPDLLFHPIVAGWFEGRFEAATDVQRLSWPHIAAGGHTLLAAPTGSGKTLAAFLFCIDRLMRQAMDGTLRDETEAIYVSPLKALSNDIRRNLEEPLDEIAAAARAAGCTTEPVRIAVRTGDTPTSQRQAMLRKPPHILVTTPESLYLLLTGPKSRDKLRHVRTVIVDEIHALARDKRGSHLTLSLARLDRLCETPPTRIGLSATQRPIEEIARFLVGTPNVGQDNKPNCNIVDTGHVRHLDLAIEVPVSELSAVCSTESWQEIYARLSTLIREHRSTLIFVNTRRMAERLAHYLEEQLGPGHVASHHGSLSREIRLKAEERLKAGELKAIVATASLELGIDIGYIDLVCQIGSPRSIATFLQRVGRAGHALGRIPKGRLVALTRDELLESLALVRAVRTGQLDQVIMPVAPLDILAQQMIAATACEDFDEDDLFELMRQAWPYHTLTRESFDAIVKLLSEGFAPQQHDRAYLHRDRIHHRLRARRGARIAAITSGGAIPEQADYRVVTEGERAFVGTLNEDFAIESQTGDVFLLGTTSWRIVHVRGGEVTVRDTHGAPATAPFWLGEAPGRTKELSREVSDFRVRLASEAAQSRDKTIEWLKDECGADDWSASQAVEYALAQVAAIGLVPAQNQVVFERFFDESGGMQLVIHAPFGSRINRAWGLAMRKCFCRSFDFELQASADDNGVVLSIGPQHSFAIDRLFGLLGSDNAKDLLVQALLAAPMFLIRWRWNATRALAVLRQRGGKKVPPPLQRFRADDLLTSVFPMQNACFEHRTGDLEPPDHPLVHQTIDDCLHEAMDLPGLLDVLKEIEAGRIELIARDTREPSPFSYQLLNANPYAFLDDAPLEERRARAVATRRMVRADDVRDLARLDPDAIAQVCAEAWPVVRDAEELHDLLLSTGVLPEIEGQPWALYFDQLVATGRAARLNLPGRQPHWMGAEQEPIGRSAFPTAAMSPNIVLPPELQREVKSDEAICWIVRGRLSIVGPTTAERIADDLGLPVAAVTQALEELEIEGFLLRGQFTSTSAGVEWCERRLLARIHRLTLDGLRRQVQPVPPEVFQRFLVRHQRAQAGRLVEDGAGAQQVIKQLQGFEAPAAAWERFILPARSIEYDACQLDEIFQRGELVWGRLTPPIKKPDGFVGGHLLTRITPLSLVVRADLGWLLAPDRAEPLQSARGDAQVVYEALRTHGALFFDDLLAAADLLPSQLESVLRELSALGLATADGYGAVRGLISKSKSSPWRPRRFKPRRAGASAAAGASGVRWSRFPPFFKPATPEQRAERWAAQLLDRYGVVFRDLLTRETAAPPWREMAAIYRRREA